MDAATFAIAMPSLGDSVMDDVPAPLRRLCAHSSPSHDRDGLANTARVLVGELEALGLDARVDDELVITARSRGSSTPRLAVVGHYDTVLPAAPARLEGDRFLAVGAADMKGGIAAFLGALERTRHQADRWPEMAIAWVPDEEIGGPAGPEAVRRLASTCAEMWVLEPGSATDADTETVVVGRWGLATWSLAARGVAAHSGIDFETGRSAVVAVARWIDQAHRATVEPGLSSFNAANIVVPADADDGRPPLNVIPLNVIPTRARVVGESRFADEVTAARRLEELESLADRVQRETGVELAFEVEERVRAYAAAHADAWWPVLRDTAAEVGLDLRREGSRRGVSFSSFLPPDSRTLVIDGLGPVGGGMHTPDEWVSLRSLRGRTRLLSRLLRMGGLTTSS